MHEAAQTPSPPAEAPAPDPPSLARLVRVFGRIGVLSFGGPAAQIALMHRILVDETRWLGERAFLSALGFCMLLPGPEAMQLATYAGWRLRGVVGGLIAGGLFVLPGALVIGVLSALYGAYGSLPAVESLFLGVKAAILAIVLQALLRMGRRALKDRVLVAVAVSSFVALYVFALPFPLVVAAAAASGVLRAGPPEGPLPPAPVAPWRTALVLGLGILVWLGPLLLLDGLLAEIARVFARLAVVTFGGAYAVLTYLAQDAVVRLGWLDAGQMMDGLGLAETTPGPLILVTQFVGTIAGLNAGGPGLATAAALVTLWATFVPCFVWIFAGAPWIERIAAMPRLSGALDAITAAAVGVIANLGLWFALHTLFDDVARRGPWPLRPWLPAMAAPDPAALALAVLGGVLLLGFRLGLAPTLALSALGGLLLGE